MKIMEEKEKKKKKVNHPYEGLPHYCELKNTK
jgi:hypothetical protein